MFYSQKLGMWIACLQQEEMLALNWCKSLHKELGKKLQLFRDMIRSIKLPTVTVLDVIYKLTINRFHRMQTTLTDQQ